MPTPTKIHPAFAGIAPCPESGANSISENSGEPCNSFGNEARPKANRAAKKQPAGKPCHAAGRQDRASAQATSRARPTTKRPGRATLNESEPCLARLPEREAEEKLSANGKKRGVRLVLEPDAVIAPDKPKRGRPPKRVRLADAFRSEGLDERKIARNYRVALAKLTGELPMKDDAEGGGAVEKLLLDTLKECRTILDPLRPASDRAPDTPAVVKLIHRVPRPARRKS